MKTPIIINKKRYLVSNTCAFDSVCILIAMAYTDSKDYQKFINKSDNALLTFSKDLAINGPSPIIYKKRLGILKTIFQEDLGITDVVVINAECNVLHIITTLMKTNPSTTNIKTCSNNNCEVKEHISPTIILKLADGFSSLQKNLQQYCEDKNIKCFDCQNNAVSKRTLHEHLFIETDMYDELTALTDYPIEIIIDDKA